MTVKEIAALEGRTIQTVRQWIKLKKLKARATATGYFIAPQDYKSYKNKRGEK